MVDGPGSLFRFFRPACLRGPMPPPTHQTYVWCDTSVRCVPDILCCCRVLALGTHASAAQSIPEPRTDVLTGQAHETVSIPKWARPPHLLRLIAHSGNVR
jgi:hypothetical protein